MAGMNTIRDKAKNLWIKGMKTIGNTAASIANNTKYKVDEMTLQNQRRELSNDLSDVVYAQWMKGEKFSPELTKILEEMQRLDDRLNDMRAEKYGHTDQTGVRQEADADSSTTTAGEPDSAGEEANPEPYMEEVTSLREEDVSIPMEILTGTAPSVQSEINNIFDHTDSVDKMAEKVNSTLNQLTDRIRSFSPEATEEQEARQKAKP